MKPEIKQLIHLDSIIHDIFTPEDTHDEAVTQYAAIMKRLCAKEQKLVGNLIAEQFEI